MRSRLGILSIGITTLFAVALLAWIAIIDPRRLDHDRDESTYGAVSSLAWYFVDHRDLHGDWPTSIDLSGSWAEDIPTENGTPVDLWGNPLTIRKLGDAVATDLLIYSFGRNEIDEYGAGDDIAVALKVRDTGVVVERVARR